MEASYYIENKDGSVTCTLCPHKCNIKNGKYGICGVRINIDGKLISKVYGLASALHQDPIEKKPLYHFYPGSNILSLGSYGCNLKCNFCQNHHISQAGGTNLPEGINLSPLEVASRARTLNNNIGLAFTYNEPVVWFEYMLDTARLVKEYGMKTVLISNAYIQSKPLKDLIPFIDAFNIDLKAYDNNFYRNHTGGSLKPVLESIKTISGSGKHIELTMLIIQGLNDDPDVFKSMTDWIVENCGENTVLHLSKYFPNYKSNIPITPDKKLLSLFDIAKKKIYYSYLGNTSMQTGRDTVCPECGNLLIERKSYNIGLNGLDNEGFCSRCHYRLTSYSSF